MAMTEEEIAELKRELEQQKMMTEMQRNASDSMKENLRLLRSQMDSWASDKEKQTAEMKSSFEQWAAGKEVEVSQLRAEIVAMQNRQIPTGPQYFDMEG